MGLAGALLISAAPNAQAPDAGAVRNRLDAYLLAYEPQLSALVADEEMTQRVVENRWKVTQRRIHSEVAFIALPGEAGWLGFRRVLKVNGRPIQDRGVPLSQLMQEGRSDDYDQARMLLADSAGHNLGAPRTTNLPNLPLEFLHPRNRHRFTQRIDGTERVRGAATTRLVFDEISTPTMIQRLEGGDMPSHVMAWVETASGRLVRADVKTRDARIGVFQFEASVWVDFRESPDLGLLVPVEMKEVFFVNRGNEGVGTAAYSNYRRFQTSARIVPPPGR